LASYEQALEAAKRVGFEVLEYEDRAILKDCHDPWYLTLKGKFSLRGFRMTRLGRWYILNLLSPKNFFDVFYSIISLT
jgi:sterol 24-C-methyltransferase